MYDASHGIKNPTSGEHFKAMYQDDSGEASEDYYDENTGYLRAPAPSLPERAKWTWDNHPGFDTDGSFDSDSDSDSYEWD